ncbi:MAG TPA: class I SAM-dependent methyltransferase [Candidatus Saccharimonadales bacterium]|nr:class I SAM-dependent methyltransferase [Candidatus Saccharimonadales bacterium]
MSKNFAELASEPTQYDNGELSWASEGEKQHFTRRMILEAITPYLGDVQGERILDVGSGLGWLCDELTLQGGKTVGIEPSATNMDAAKKQFPELDFRHTSLEEFDTTEQFDLVTATMVFEHLGDLGKTYEKLGTLLKPGGRLVVLSGDFERFTLPRFDYQIDVQPIQDDEVAVRTDYGERAGVFYDIIRTPDRFIGEATSHGFELSGHTPYAVPRWVLTEMPRYNVFEGKPLFQVFEFEPATSKNG